MTNLAFVRFLPFMDCVEKAFFFLHMNVLFALKKIFYCIYCICNVSFFQYYKQNSDIVFCSFFFSFIGFFFLFPYFALMIISTSVDLSEKSTRKKCST
jgi:hypothetical protein